MLAKAQSSKMVIAEEELRLPENGRLKQEQQLHKRSKLMMSIGAENGSSS
jgi:hypothetical protein